MVYNKWKHLFKKWNLVRSTKVCVISSKSHTLPPASQCSETETALQLIQQRSQGPEALLPAPIREESFWDVQGISISQIVPALCYWMPMWLRDAAPSSSQLPCRMESLTWEKNTAENSGILTAFALACGVGATHQKRPAEQPWGCCPPTHQALSSLEEGWMLEWAVVLTPSTKSMAHKIFPKRKADWKRISIPLQRKWT